MWNKKQGCGLKILGLGITSHCWGRGVPGAGAAFVLVAEFHTALCRMGCTNWGLTYENPSKSDWSMLAMTSWSGGVRTGCPRVKNLSKFSAPLPHCGEKRTGGKVRTGCHTRRGSPRALCSAEGGRAAGLVRQEGFWGTCRPPGFKSQAEQTLMGTHSGVNARVPPEPSPEVDMHC